MHVSNGVRASDGEELTEVDRRRMVSYLRRRYSKGISREDVEDLVQEALIEVFVRRRRGERIKNPIAYMRAVAWRDARDLLRARREIAIDPSDQVLAGVADPSSPPEERLDDRAELARAIEAIEQLESNHRAAYRARFIEELSTKEACRRFSLPSSTYHHRLRRAIETVQARLESKRFAAKLLAAYVAGIASRAERRRAERLIRNDPRSAALAREF